MKNRIIFTLLLTLVIALVLNSCGPNDYKKACEEGDYNLARELAERTKNSYGNAPSKWDIQERIKEINERELTELVTENNRQNNSRILFIYNNYKSNATDFLPDMTKILNIAISLNNQDLAIKLLQSGVMPDIETAKNAAISESDEVMELLLEDNSNLILEPVVFNAIKKNYSEKEFKKFILSLISINPSLLLEDEKIKSQIENLPERDELILQALNSQYNIIVNSKPSIMTAGSYGYVHDFGKRVNTNNTAINNYNNKLAKLVDYALMVNNKNIAIKAVNAMLPNIEIKYNGPDCIAVYNKDFLNEHKKKL